jgi:hypothetical protein
VGTRLDGIETAAYVIEKRKGRCETYLLKLKYRVDDTNWESFVKNIPADKP